MMNNIEARIEVLSPKAGDSLVFGFPTILTEQQRESIRKQVAPLVPDGVQVVLLDGGVTLQHVAAPVE